MSLHDVRDNKFQPGNHRKPMRCTDMSCPSRDRCQRPGFDGKDGEFQRNRGNLKFCGYLIFKEGRHA